jgi:hypothetical protein
MSLSAVARATDALRSITGLVACPAYVSSGVFATADAAGADAADTADAGVAAKGEGRSGDGDVSIVGGPRGVRHSEVSPSAADTSSAVCGEAVR